MKENQRESEREKRERKREPTKENLHINKRQSGGATHDMAAGRDKEMGAEEEDSGDFMGPEDFT